MVVVVIPYLIIYIFIYNIGNNSVATITPVVKLYPATLNFYRSQLISRSLTP